MNDEISENFLYVLEKFEDILNPFDLSSNIKAINGNISIEIIFENNYSLYLFWNDTMKKDLIYYKIFRVFQKHSFINLSDGNNESIDFFKNLITNTKSACIKFIDFKDLNYEKENLCLVGIDEEKYLGNIVEGHNCNFRYIETELIRHVLYFKNKKSNLFYRFVAYIEYGECGSGWTTATWGCYEIEEIITIPKNIKYLFKNPLEIELEKINNDEDSAKNLKIYIINDIEYKLLLFIDNCGEDFYYPSGDYSIYLDVL